MIGILIFLLTTKNQIDDGQQHYSADDANDDVHQAALLVTAAYDHAGNPTCNSAKDDLTENSHECSSCEDE